MNRIVGLETEFGCLAPEGLGAPSVPARVRDYLFYQRKLGLIDLHERDYDEPPGNGGFLFNGGKLYLDMGHVEYCTPECVNLGDVVAYDRVGECLLQQSLAALDLGEGAGLYKNNIDHYTGATFGCHENYSMKRDAPLHEKNVESLLTFLVVRSVLIGAGRVGSSRTLWPDENGAALAPDSVPFQMTQRADFIQTDIYEWVQFNRAIINARDEPLADYRRFRRLHLLLGDSNVLPFANALKVGMTGLILDVLEADRLPYLPLENPVASLRQLSHSMDPLLPLLQPSQGTIPALDLLEKFFLAAEALGQKDADTVWILEAWRSAMKDLREDPLRLLGRVDWITKHTLLDQFRQSENLSWQDPWLESLDLEYHQLDPAKCLAAAFPEYELSALTLPTPRLNALETDPPDNTRAKARTRLMHEIVKKKHIYVLDWDAVYIPQVAKIILDDPFIAEWNGEF